MLPKNEKSHVDECASNFPVTEQWKNNLVLKKVLACRQVVVPPALPTTLFLILVSDRYCRTTVLLLLAMCPFKARERSEGSDCC